MADRIKAVSRYDGNNWVDETPIGADASNVDVQTAGSTSRDLQSVLGTPPVTGNITTSINSKVSIAGGDVADTIVSKDITNYDSSTEVDDDILTNTAVTMSTNTSTLWSRFNLFRKKVSNNFENYFAKSSLVGSTPGVTSTGDNNTAYTTAAINNYLSNVIGYTSASAPSAGTVASQLSSLKNKLDVYQDFTKAITDQSELHANNGIMWFTTISGVSLFNNGVYLCGIATYSKGLFVSSGDDVSTDAIIIWGTPEAYAYVAFRNGANWTQFNALTI